MKTNASFFAVGVFFATLTNCLGQTNVHRFGTISALPDQTITLELLGNVPTAFRPYFDIYALEASTDLVNWTPLPTLLRTNNSSNAMLYTNSVVNSGARFYRMFTNHLITPFPEPTGPYKVGTLSRLVTDPSRTNRYGIVTNSSFMVQFWYPAEAKEGMLPTPFVEKQLALVPNYFCVSTNVIAGFVSHALPEAPLATNQARYPILIDSHGFTGFRAANTDKALDLASHGYVVVAIDHMDAFATVFPGDRLVVGNVVVNLNLSYLTPIFEDRLKDIEFVLEELARLNATDALFAGRLDLERVGAYGYSLGGGTVAEFSRIDNRCKAVALLDGYLDPAIDLKRLGLQKPFLSFNSTIDPNSTGVPGYKGWLVDSKGLFDKATSDAFWCQIKGSVHFSFNAEGTLISNPGCSGAPTTASRRQSLAMRVCMVSFFDKYLKNHDDHLLDDPGVVYPEVISFLKK